MGSQRIDADGLYVRSRKTWRKWLMANHEKRNNIWLKLFRKDSGTPCVKYEEAVEEALCFGWIDSRSQKKDEHHFLLFFSKRNPKSAWSASNKKRIEKLIADNLMMPAGMAMIEMAKTNGNWTRLDKVEAMEIPGDLNKALKMDKTASKYFNAFPASVKKGILHWIGSAKRDETRQKRVEETVRLAGKNIRANQWKPKQQ